MSFLKTFDKHNNEIEPDSHDIDKTLNSALSNALVDQWQTNPAPVNPLTQDDPEADFQHNGPHVSLTTEVEARFANTLVMRTGKPDYVPMKTNLGLKYK